jgi:LPXTG-motif cell wall-anchored protein
MAWRKVLAVSAAAVAVGALVLPSLAFADPTNPPLHQSGQHILASSPGYNGDDCNGVTADGDEDIWVFVWPGNEKVGDITSVTIGWDVDGDHDVDQTRSYPGPDATLITTGTPKVAFVTPAGWRLEEGSSSVTGHTSHGVFNLTHTCAGEEEPPCDPAEEGCVPPPDDPCITDPEAPECNPDPCETAGIPAFTDQQPDPCATTTTETTTETTTTHATTTTTRGGLPQTGASLTGMIAAGIALVAAGATILFLRRRRSITED